MCVPPVHDGARQAATASRPFGRDSHWLTKGMGGVDIYAYNEPHEPALGGHLYFLLSLSIIITYCCLYMRFFLSFLVVVGSRFFPFPFFFSLIGCRWNFPLDELPARSKLTKDRGAWESLLNVNGKRTNERRRRPFNLSRKSTTAAASACPFSSFPQQQQRMRETKMVPVVPCSVIIVIIIKKRRRRRRWRQRRRRSPLKEISGRWLIIPSSLILFLFLPSPWPVFSFLLILLLHSSAAAAHSIINERYHSRWAFSSSF